ncbi:MAG: TlpA family protein disulfide reductase [Ignavibacteriales bacterium]|nr:TlpA family protein disulfide reductase [Ignavibacteriales bacterium]
MTKNQKNEKEQEQKQNPLKNKKVRGYIYLGGFLLLVLILFLVNNDIFSSKSDDEEGPLPPNYYVKKTGLAIAPDFSLSTTDSKELKLSDYKGKIVILDFFATWCPPCRVGIPDLLSIKEEYKNDVEIIGISLDEASGPSATRQDLIPFMKEMEINYPVVYYTNDVILKYGGIEAIPTTFIIDKEGNIYSQYVGLQTRAQYVSDIIKILNQR